MTKVPKWLRMNPTARFPDQLVTQQMKIEIEIEMKIEIEIEIEIDSHGPCPSMTPQIEIELVDRCGQHFPLNIAR